MTHSHNHYRLTIRFWIVAIVMTCVLGACQREKRLERFRYEQRHLGTYVRLVFYAPSEAVANRAAEATYKKVAKLDAVFSNYRLDSEIMRLCTHANWETDESPPVEVSHELWTVLKAADRFSRQSDGAFDVTVGPLTRLWKRAIKDKSLPDQDRIDKARRERVGYEYIEFVASEGGGSGGAVKLLRPNMRIDVGAIAKGYIADELLKELARFEIDSALIDIGGDLALGNAPPDKQGWTVSLEAPSSIVQDVKGEEATSGLEPKPPELLLANCGVATSGDTFQRLEIDGKVYSHILDGRTGIGVTHRTNVTTIAPDAMTADALASTLSILNLEEGRKFIRSYPKSAAMLINVDEPDPESGVSVLGDASRFGNAGK